jgi:hypothetical protein
MPELVTVTWLDATFALDEVPKLATVETTGWLLDTRDAAAISVAGERIGEEEWRAVTTIPRVCVMEIRTLGGTDIAEQQ